MDGQLIAVIIISILGVGVPVGGGFWKLGRAIGRLEGKVDGLDTESIGRLEGKVDSLGDRMHSYETQMDGFDKRVDRLDRRINGWLDTFVKKESD